VNRDDWSFPFEGPLHEVFPALHNDMEGDGDG
jgi:hypothetical protein